MCHQVLSRDSEPEEGTCCRVLEEGMEETRWVLHERSQPTGEDGGLPGRCSDWPKGKMSRKKFLTGHQPKIASGQKQSIG